MKNFSEYLKRPQVYKLPPLESFDKEKIIKEIYKGCKKDNGVGQTEGYRPNIAEYCSSNFGGYQSSRNDEYFPITLRYFKKRLESPEGIDFPHQITSAWANINKKGDFNSPHHHGPYGFSAILFVTDSPGLQFIDLSVHGYPQHLINHIDGKSGEMIIFPSPYLHWVLPSESEEDRITFAVNIEVSDSVYDNLYTRTYGQRSLNN